MSTKWDVIIIGSGIGGLTCGAFLAKKGMRVKVLEKHYRIGGYAHSFNRGQFRFESGIHSVPLARNGYVFTLLNALGIENKIETISHDAMYYLHIGDKKRVMPLTLNAIKEELGAAFPGESANLNNLLSDMHSLYKNIIGPLYNFEPKGNETNPSILKKYQEHTYQTYIESFIKDPSLRQFFYSQWPFTGLTSEYASTTFFALLYYVHVLEGSHYLKGGFEALADALASVITQNGGEVCTNSLISKLYAENGLIRHAVLETGEVIEGREFISNVSPYILMDNLLEPPFVNRLWKRRLSNLTCSASAVAVYLGLDKDISDLLPGNIHFWYDHGDFNKMQVRINNCSSDLIDHLVLLKTPDASDQKTLFLMSYINYRHTTNWSTVKETIGTRMIDLAEKIIPGLSGHIQCKVFASPCTFERYTANSEGSLYGFTNSADRYHEAKIPMQTYIPNLYQTGHWCRGGGIWNVMESGFTVSRLICEKLGIKLIN